MDKLESLTPQQREVVLVLIQVNTLKETAFRLSLRPKTASDYWGVAKKRLGLKGLVDLGIFAVRNGLV